MSDEQAVEGAPVVEISKTGPAVLENPSDPAPDRQKLAAALREEMNARSTRCMKRIEAILEEENCVLEARIRIPEVSPGIFGITADPGVRAL